MELTYTKRGDYLMPDLTLPEQPTIGRYGVLRHRYLREHRHAIYTGMLLTGELDSHLAEIDRQAKERMAMLVSQMKVAHGLTEQLKAEDPMKWVGLMNNIRSAAEEVILSELIYS